MNASGPAPVTWREVLTFYLVLPFAGPLAAVAFVATMSAIERHPPAEETMTGDHDPIQFQPRRPWAETEPRARGLRFPTLEVVVVAAIILALLLATLWAGGLFEQPWASVPSGVLGAREAQIKRESLLVRERQLDAVAGHPFHTRFMARYAAAFHLR